MEERRLRPELVAAFMKHLTEEELAEGTILKYKRDLSAFMDWVQDTEISKETSAAWKNCLVQRGYAPATINSMLAAINTFFKFVGWYDCSVKFLKIQRKLFREQNKELTAAEFKRLVGAAEAGGKGVWRCFLRP